MAVAEGCSVTCLQETTDGQAAEAEEVEALPTTQQLSFDLGSLRACFKRKREDAGAMQEATESSKKGCFDAASLQVGHPLLCSCNATGTAA